MEMDSCTPIDGSSPWAHSTFKLNVLPRRSRAASPPLEPNPPVFEDYLSLKTVLKQRRDEDPQCRESWAFVLSGAVQYATWLAYDRLGLHFDNTHMSVEFLLSCYFVEPNGMCGCFGADLPTALQAISEHGEVTFRQFPFVAAGSVNQEVYSGLESLYFCQDRSWHGTCPPCNAGDANFIISALAGSVKKGGVRFVVPCTPCHWPSGPRYFPQKPFHIIPTQEGEAVKTELRRLGPLCAALGLDAESFAALQAAGEAPHVKRTRDGLFYRPTRMSADGIYQAVLIVAYHDADADGDGFWVCRTSHGRDDIGYTLTVGSREVIGLFNVPMSLPGSWLIDRVLSFNSIEVRRQPGAALTVLGPGDPFTGAPAKASGTAASVAAPSSASPSAAPKPVGVSEVLRRRRVLGIAIAAVVTLVVILLLGFMFLRQENESARRR